MIQLVVTLLVLLLLFLLLLLLFITVVAAITTSGGVYSWRSALVRLVTRYKLFLGQTHKLLLENMIM